jgi:hypothetical protein
MTEGFSQADEELWFEVLKKFQDVKRRAKRK